MSTLRGARKETGEETSLGTGVHVPVDGDVLQQLVGQAVKQDDSLGGNFQSDLLGLLSTRFGLLDTQKITLAVLWHFLSRGIMMHAS